MMSDAARALAEFHAALGDLLGRGNAALRTTLHCEEHTELLAELHNLRSLEDGGVAMSDVPQSRERLARELGDVVYIAYGTAHAFDIDLDAGLVEIHRAAMSKVAPACPACDGDGWVCDEGGAQADCDACDGSGKGERVVREDGKILKPVGFRPPDMKTAVASV